MSFEVVQNATKQVVAGVSTIDAVIAIGVDLHVKRLVGLHQRLRHFSAVAEMHIVIGSAVNEQEITMEFIHTSYGIDSVVVSVFLGSTHITLGVNCVVILPVGRRSDSYSTTEHGTTVCHSHQSVETSKAPSPKCDA